MFEKKTFMRFRQRWDDMHCSDALESYLQIYSY